MVIIGTVMAFHISHNGGKRFVELSNGDIANHRIHIPWIQEIEPLHTGRNLICIVADREPEWNGIYFDWGNSLRTPVFHRPVSMEMMGYD